MKNTISLLTIFFSVATFGYSQTTPRETPLPSTAPGGTQWVVYGQEDRVIYPNAQIPADIPTKRNPFGIYGSGSRADVADIDARQLARSTTKKSVKIFKVVPPMSYQQTFSKVLKNKNYNLATIATLNQNCEGSPKKNQDCQKMLQLWSGGSSYSFRNDTNFDDKSLSISDIRILNNRFEVGSRWTQGIISELGNVELESLNLKSSELQYLVNFKPERDYREVHKQRASIAKGTASNGYFYSTEAPIKLNSTYLVRSIAFSGDNRTDIIVAFKVVGIESDNNIVILWKELKISKSPPLK